LSSSQVSVDLSYRLGAAILASLSGLVLGLLFGCVLLYLGVLASLSLAVAVGSLAGAASGFAFPLGAMDFSEGTIHFLVGFFREGASPVVDVGEVDSEEMSSLLYHGSSRLPEWLRWSFLFGTLFAGALSLVASL
jgi:hypothetical protein